MRILLLVLVAGLATAAPATEVIDLGGGRKVVGPVLKETPSEVFVDLGYTVLGVPKSEIVHRSAVKKKGVKSAPKDVSAGDLYRTAELAEASVKEKVEEVSGAVVLVSTPRALGSGFIIDPRGYAITNNHVIQGETRISVTLFKRAGRGFQKQKVEKVRIVAENPYVDLALLKIDGQGKLPFVYLARSDSYRVGETVFAIGNPMGLDRSVSKGILSSLNRPFDGLTYLQTTAQINPGNSGGPLFDLKGEVIGVTNMKLFFSEGLSFAVPIDRVKWFLSNRNAFSYDKDNPNTGYRYLPPPRKNEKKPGQPKSAPAKTGKARAAAKGTKPEEKKPGGKKGE